MSQNLVFFSRISLISLFIIISKYLFRNLSSTSWSPCHFSGSGRRLFESICQSFISSVFSPLLVVKNFPCASTKSPISTTSFQKSNFLSPRMSFLSRPWKVPVPSFKVMKTIAPCPRMDMILPAIHLISLLFSKSPKVSAASFREISLFDSAGYGSIPLSFKSPSFFILASLISSIEDI